MTTRFTFLIWVAIFESACVTAQTSIVRVPRIEVMQTFAEEKVSVLKDFEFAAPEEKEKRKKETKGRFPENPEWEYSQQQLIDLIATKKNWASENVSQRAVNAWQCIGPYRSYTANTALQLTGRVRKIETYVPVGNELGIKLCTGTGGIWRLDYSAGRVIPVSLHGNLPVGDVGSFAINPLNGNVMFAGTGEPANAGGVGLYKTTDGGSNWTKLFSIASTPDWFNEVLIAPDDTAVVYAASRDGLDVSYSGGAGFFRKLSGDVTALVIDPQHPDTLYCSVFGKGIKRSYDQGWTWDSLSNGPSAPGHVALAVSASSPNIIYALVTKNDYPACNTLGMYKSIDYGDNWTLCNMYTAGGKLFNPDSVSFHWNQGYYNNCIAVNPNDPNVIMAGAGPVLRSTDGGMSFNESNVDVHADHHSFVWSKDGQTLYQGNDGGIFSSTDNGANWSSSFNWLPVTQFYEMDIADLDGRYIYGCTQDNSGICRSPSIIPDSLQWNHGPGGDGWSVAGGHENVMQGTLQNGGDINFTGNGGASWANEGVYAHIGFNFPRSTRSENLNINFPNQFCIEQGSRLFYRLSSGIWASTMGVNDLPDAIAYHSIGNRNLPTDRNNIYVSMRANRTDKLYVYDRNNGNWFQCTKNLPAANNEFYRVYTHHYNYDDAYAVLQGPATGSRIFKTSDAAITNWRNITGDFPDNIKINVLLAHPLDTNKIFLGTYRFGVWRTDDGGAHWHQWMNGMPTGADVSGIDFIDSTLYNGKFYLVASTYGRSMYMREVSGSDPSAIQPPDAEAVKFNLENFGSAKTGSEILLRGFVSEPATVLFTLLDMSGKKIAAVSEYVNGNFYKTWQPDLHSSGVYLCTMEANQKRAVKKLIVIE